MKIRESGMPEKQLWENFFDPPKILEALGVGDKIKAVVEFGCGYGTFTIPTAKIIKGKVFALDIDAEMVRLTKEESKKQSLGNIEVSQRDFITNGSGLPDESMDYAMLFNILHLENPTALIDEAKRVLKKNGKLGIIHWNYDAKTPRGPSMAIRPKPEQSIHWAEESGFHYLSQHDLKPYHYGIVLKKESIK